MTDRIRVIFLDFDGVLNDMEYLCGLPGIIVGSPSEIIDPVRVARLQHIIDETGAVIVYSTAWRNNSVEGGLGGMLTDNGLERFTAIGQTPSLNRPYSVNRSEEIKRWLRGKRFDVESFVVLEDDHPMPGLKARVVRTKTQGPNGGLQDDHAARAITLLKTPLRDDEYRD